jgi:hypothetical protein
MVKLNNNDFLKKIAKYCQKWNFKTLLEKIERLLLIKKWMVLLFQIFNLYIDLQYYKSDKKKTLQIVKKVL